MVIEKVLFLRHSVRSFKNQEVSKELVNKILIDGMSAPVSHKKYKDIQFTVIEDKKYLARLTELINESTSQYYNAPVVILISSKESNIPNISEFNVACIVENMLLCATNPGLGSVFLTKFIYEINKNKDFRDTFQISNDSQVYAAVAIGYEENNNFLHTSYSLKNVENRIPVQYF